MRFKLFLYRPMRVISAFLLFCFLSLSLFGQDRAQDPAGIWSEVKPGDTRLRGDRRIQPKQALLLGAELERLKALLESAPMEEFGDNANSQGITIYLPMPDGVYEAFVVVESPVMEPELARKYPQIRTFRGIGIDDPSATVRLDITQKGFHAMILSGEHSTVYIDPLFEGQDQFYQSYFRKDYPKTQDWVCETEDREPRLDENLEKAAIGDCTLRTYRIAIAATGQYTDFHGGTVADGMAAIVTALNRINEIYRRDFTVQFTLIADNDDIVYTDGDADPYTDGASSATLNDENQSNITSEIGSANFDVGHLFHTGGGGRGEFASVCDNSKKAKGNSGQGSPINDPFWVDYVCHELGHQFDATHTFNGAGSGSCTTGARTESTAYEPGSGTTIMAYAGICGGLNVQSNSDDHFHNISLRQVANFVSGTGCGTTTSISNDSPTITGTGGSSSYTIPQGTPFVLTGSATDPEGDALTYCWEQFDKETSTQPPVCTNSNGPNFRSRSPMTSPSRYFPQLITLLDGNNGDEQWERLPCVARSMDFRLTVRDNATGGGCTADESVSITVTNDGPFEVSNLGSSSLFAGGENVTVTWDVAGTNSAPINCGNVEIWLSEDGGASYTTLLENSTPNDGSANVQMPMTDVANGRIMVKCNSNIFFDINDGNVKVDNTPPSISCTPTLVRDLQPDCTYTLEDLTTTAGASDNFDPSPTITQSPVSGTVYNAEGYVTLTFTATDDAGLSSSCTTQLYVQDVTPPTVFCGGPFLRDTDPGVCEYTAQGGEFDAIATDACGIDNVVYDYTGTATLAGAVFPEGTTTVNYTATDVNGNSSSCSFTVTIEDNEPPMAVCKDLTVVFNGEDFIMPAPSDIWDEAASTDNCGPTFFVSAVPDKVYCEDLGDVIPVTVTIEDLHNNTDDCISYVTLDGLPCGWSQEPDGVGCTNGNSVDYDVPTETFTVESTNCYYDPPFSGDELGFAQYDLCGDGALIAYVEDISGTTFGWAGITMRENNDAGAKKIQLMSNGSNLVRREVRYTTNGTLSPQQYPSFGKRWLRLVRSGNQFHGYISPNGVNWQYVMAATINMSECIEIGLVVTNYNPNSTVTASFTNVTVIEGAPVTLLDIPQAEILTDESRIDAYPNPSNGKLTVEIQVEEEQEGTLQLIDQFGRLMREQQLVLDPLQTVPMDINQVPSGVYFLKLHLKDGEILHRKIVKK